MSHKQESSPYKFKYIAKPKTPESLIMETERAMGGRLTETSLSDEQAEVFKEICEWYECGYNPARPVLRCGGYAGVGKSTIIAVLASFYAGQQLMFCAYTGKATSVLRKKFYAGNVPLERSEIKTVHSLLYYPLIDEVSGVIRGWMHREKCDTDFIIIDEASMLDKKLFNDLLAYKKPLLAIGDHGQLPPIFGEFNLMEKPDLTLEHIHRQAENSPILALSEFVRRTGQVPRFTDDSMEVQVLNMSQLDNVVSSIMQTPGIHYDNVGMLTFTNADRVHLNNQAREARAIHKEGLCVGDQVICLRNVEETIFNGMRGIVTKLDSNFETVFHYYGTVLFEDDEIQVEGPICKPQFGRDTTIKDFNEYAQITGQLVKNWHAVGLLFDYGYALTVHKSQGSEFEHVIVVNDVPRNWSYDLKKRALYTAVTRCSRYLVVLQ